MAMQRPLRLARHALAWCNVWWTNTKPLITASLCVGGIDSPS